MTEDQRETLRSAVLEAILLIAPDLEPDELGDDADLHEALGLDSIDRVNVASEIAKRTGVEIPESAASALRTVGDLVAAVVARGGGGD